MQLRILNILQETSTAKTFVVEAINGERIEYAAGQFLPLIFKSNTGIEERRNYSFSSCPGVDAQPHFTVKRVENGAFSRLLVEHTAIGDILTAQLPAGYFQLPEKDTSPTTLYFFAAGSGITPIFSLIKYALHYRTELKVVLIYSNSNIAETIFYAALNHLQQQFTERFTIVYFFSDSNDINRKRISSSSMESLLTVFNINNRTDALFYLCGPFDYMQFISIYLRNYGVPNNNIRKELFNIVVPDFRPKPPDELPHSVTIELAKKKETITVQYPQTILQAAKAKGMNLPYSCEAGQCGTCAATCVAGKVFMWRNDVLLDEELAKGRILTCTGYPIDGDVELRY